MALNDHCNSKSVAKLLIFMMIWTRSLGLPTGDDELKQEFTNHRLELLENGFNVFANEFLPTIEKMQKKLQFVTETNKKLSKQLHEVAENNDHLLDTVNSQESEITDLLWAVADLKNNGLSIKDQNLLSEIEWTVFDLKHSTMELMEEMCLKEATCSAWSEWSVCSVSCGTGSSSRSRACKNDGKFKSYCDPAVYETTDCTRSTCGVISLSLPDCPESYVSYRGYCFRFSDQPASRLLATILCETDDAHLVEIDSPEKQAIVSEYLQTVVPTYMKQTDITIDDKRNSDFRDLDDDYMVAIDGKRFSKETDYLNWKEKKMEFFKWATGQPRNSKSDGDYCITLSLKDDHWYLRCCTKIFSYVCEAPEGGII